MTLAIQDHFADPILDALPTREIDIDNRGNSSELTDYQVAVDVSNHIDQQCVRFVDENLQIVDYWEEDSDIAWAELPKIIGGKVSSVRMLYGDVDIASDGEATFDDFIDNDDPTYSFTKYSSNPIISPGGTGEWDEKVVYSMALPCNINNNLIMLQGSNNDEYWLFYTGAGDTASPNHETSIGLAKSTDFRTFVKYSSNPVINRSDVGLGGSGQGLAVFDIKHIGTKYYMFLMAMYSNTDFRIAMMESTDLLTWSNFTVVLDSNYKDHCPYVIEDPNDSNKLIMYFSYQPSSGDAYYRIGRATAYKSAPYTWTYDTVNNPILYIAGKHIIYPFVEYNSGTYNLYFCKYPSSNHFATYKTSNTTDVNFSDSNNLIINYGMSGEWDDGYAGVPRKYTNGIDHWIYYSGRKYGSNLYTGIGLTEWLLEYGTLSEWDVVNGDVSLTTSHSHSGEYGIEYVGGTTKPEVQKNCVGNNKVYETWIYDDMTTTGNFQQSVRLYDTAGHDPLVAIDTKYSTTHYVYRKEGGSWTVSSIERSEGWHKISFVVRDLDTLVYIDDILVFTETGLDEDDLDFFRVIGYTNGVGYSDTYLVRKYTSPEPTTVIA